VNRSISSVFQTRAGASPWPIFFMIRRNLPFRVIFWSLALAVAWFGRDGVRGVQPAHAGVGPVETVRNRKE